ncbi:choice-of-anchor M domain-containing protein [Amycolatopsis sp. PS_44_ISF1]|uniref:choice-of-anchor M domain-containing protein n=1 Tax=Amycolatopsis sp. PS_44_ISF1 TaxID=2974917 RepID=UPI0028DDF519|nr:choice-of-anchor M domain-containing protein [Amycolatopsis sp. PS_44_ISF1]MDT8914954.1 choice-of-anchor M domain-containing protein [Amycolatopsis sp. PS_44_ISF1]
MKRPGRWIALTAVAAALASSAPAAAQETAADAPPGRVVVADGHVDLGPRFAAGAWTIEIRDDTGAAPVWRHLEDVVLHAGAGARAEVPQGGEYAFLGAPGSPVWLLPQTQRAGTVWPGWNTQDPGTTAKVGREVTWRLRSVQGPGSFSLFLTGAFGAPRVVFDSRKPLPQETGIEAGSHVHGNWAFGAAGTYLLGLEMSALTVDGGRVSDDRVLRIHLGDGDPASAFAVAPPAGANQAPGGAPILVWAIGALVVASGLGALVVLLVRRRARRAEVG